MRRLLFALLLLTACSKRDVLVIGMGTKAVAHAHEASRDYVALIVQRSALANGCV